MPIAAGWFTQARPAPVVPPPPVSVVTVERQVPAFTNPSVIRIANLALQRVGVSQPIASLNEQSKEARVIRQAWDHLRDVTLQEFAWPFATQHAALAVVDEVRVPWRMTYRMPADCLHPLAINADAHVRSSSQRIPFAVQASTGGPVLVSDAEDVVLVYLARMIDPLDWPMWFHDLMAWVLAEELAMPLTVDPRMQQVVSGKLAQARVMAAQRAASTGQPPVQDAPSAFVTARGGFYSDDTLRLR